MDTHGGGWTGVDARTANQDFGAALSSEVGSGCGLVGDKPEGHVAGDILCRFDVDLGFTINAVRADMTVRSTAQGTHVSDLTHYDGVWGTTACGGSANGDWVIGTPIHGGGVLSLGEANDVAVCGAGGSFGTDALIAYRNVDENSARDTTLRMEFGETGGENEGWMWDAGYVFVRNEIEIVGARTQVEPGHWEDGTFAPSCDGYRFPSGLYAHFGSTGDGFYAIKPKAAAPELTVYCDMTTDGGGWTGVDPATADALGTTQVSLSGGAACSVLGSRPQAFGPNTVECRWDTDVGFEFNAMRTDAMEVLALSDPSEAADLTHYNQVWGAASCNDRGDMLFGTPSHSGGVLSLGRFDGAGFCAVGNDYTNSPIIHWDGDQANTTLSTTLRLELGESGAPQEGWRWDGGRILLRRDVGIVGARTTTEPGIWADGTIARSCQEYRRPAGHYAYIGSVGSGVYRIDPDGVAPAAPFDVQCDMTTDGGGWTLMGTISGGDTDNWATQYGYWSDANLLGTLDAIGEDFKNEAWVSLPVGGAEVLFERVYDGNVEAQSVLASNCLGGKTRFTQLFQPWDTALKCSSASITTVKGSAVGVASASYEEGVGTNALGGSASNGFCWGGGDTVSNIFNGHLLWSQSAYPSCLDAGHLGGVGVWSTGSTQYTVADITGTNWLNGTDYTLTAIRLYAR